MKQIVKDSYILKVLANEHVKIQPKESETKSYVALHQNHQHIYSQKNSVSHMQLNTISFQYNHSNIIGFIVLRNVYPSGYVEDIKRSINAYGHKVTDVRNAKHSKTKEPFCNFLYRSWHQKDNN